MLKRLNLLFLWAGFTALVTLYGFAAYALIAFPEPLSILDERIWGDILYIAEFPPNYTLPFIWFWLAHLYWPIRWITTGTKSPLPWAANKEAT